MAILSKRPEVERFLKSPDPAFRAAVIYGRDRGGVRERADILARAVTANPDDPFDAALMTEDEVADGRLADELSAISMMGGRRLVRVRFSTEKIGPDRVVAEALAGHMEGRFNPDAFFLIEAGAIDRASPLRKAAEKAAGCATIPCYEDEPSDVARLVREAMSADKVGLEAGALEIFVARMPRERGVARQEIERLILWLGPGSGRTASASDLDDFLGVEPEASLADAASDAFGGKLGAAQAGLRRAASEGEGGPAAVRAMGMHLARLRRILTLAQSGASLTEAAKASGVFWKNEREMLRQARAWNLEHLLSLHPEVLAADLARKTAGAPDHLLAERLALTIAGRARRLGL
jgi:DNA polymerase-3 subunit delta